MKTNTAEGTGLVRVAILALGLAAISALSLSAAEPGRRHEALPNFDTRFTNSTPEAAAKADTAAPLKASAMEILQNRVKGTKIDRHPLTGAPTFIRSTDTFLTGPSGRGGANNDAQLQALPAGDSHRTIKAFIDSNADLFGHHSDVVTTTRTRRDYLTLSSQTRTVVLEQQLNNIPVFEALLQAHLTDKDELINISSTLLADPAAAAQNGALDEASRQGTPKIAGINAIVAAAKNLGESVTEPDLTTTSAPVGTNLKQNFKATALGDVTVGLTWLPMSSSSLRLCWEIVLNSKKQNAMYRILVDAVSGESMVRHCLTDDISPATYNVFTSDSPSPFSPGYSTPSSVQPALASRTSVTLSALDTTASPNGWIDDGVTETRGNNVDAHTDTDANDTPDLPRPQATGTDRIFNFPLDLTQAPSTYKDAAVVNLFYWCNWMHDRLYQLGFTEAAGNFQNDNFGRGGLGNDAVQADAQDGSGRDNANFSTPPDGSPGRMQMYVFSYPTPNRDGDLDAEIVLHEYTHGLSNRLVGGGIGMSALQSRGMGEGWSDFYALCLLSQPGDDINGCYASGAYASYMLGGSFAENYYYGIRRYPYTTNISKNPLTFKDIDPTQASAHTGISRSSIIGNTANEVHNMGEVWCVTLWEARANLIAKHGYATGNELILQLVTDGMKLSPANPTFLQARDAILQADLVKTNGANKTELWAAFAKRGLGSDAYSPASSTSTGVAEDFNLLDDLALTPLTTATANGLIGGPFSPSNQIFTLTNTGTTTITWSAAKTQTWLTLSATTGSLAPGASATVTASINASANILAPGTYTDPISFTNTSSSSIRIRKINLTIQPPRVAYYPLDSHPGWSTTGEWAFGHPTRQGGTYYGYPDPANGATGTNVFGVNLNGDYSTALGGPYFLTAGPFNLSGITNTRLQFQRWLNSDYQPWVYETIEVSNNGTTWTEIWSNGSTAITDSAWSQFQYNIASVADNQPTVYIRWGFRVGMTTAVFPLSGWNIDDIELLGTTASTATPTVILTPSTTTLPLGKTASFTVSASCNLSLGEVGLEACDASGTPTAVLNSTILSTQYAGQTYTWTPTSAGTYYFCGYAKNSSLSQTVRTTPITTVIVAPQVEAPVFSLPGGSYISNTSVTLTTATSGASIRYTTDGSTPTATTGTLYTAPVTLTSTTTLKAIAFKSGMLDSLVTMATYDVMTGPVIVTSPSNKTVAAGASTSFSGAASGNPACLYQWQVSNDGGIFWTNLVNGTLYNGTTLTTLTVTGATASLSGNLYRFVATNNLGSATSNSALLTVTVVTSGPPTFSIQPQDTKATESTPLTLYGYATSSTTITYQWYKDGAAISGAASPTFSKATTSLTDSGLYKLAATNTSGTTYSREATITIAAATPPVFILQPQSQTVYVGTAATLTATATASPAPTYQWYKNNTAITGATGTSLALPALTTANDGESYTLAATNFAGTVTSNAAILNVYPVDSGKALGFAPAVRTVGCGRVTYPVTLRTNTDWTATKSANWITLSVTSGKNSRTIEVTVAPNPLPVERTATITIGQQTHTLTQRAAGTPISELWAAGANDFGQLCDYRMPPITYPAQADATVLSVAGGYFHTLYAKTDGTLWATGNNSFGQFGLGNFTNQPFPVQLTATGVKSVGSGRNHSLYLKTDNTLWGMGYNYYGQLGDGSTTTRSNPVQIASNVSTYSAGRYRTFFIKTDGTLWACGQNDYGELGDSTVIQKSTPVQIATGVSAVASGILHTLFVKTDGSLWTVGYNFYGQIGNGTTTNQPTPTQIATNVRDVACGGYFSMFIKTDGTLWACGDNYYGQLGIGSSTSVTNPVQIASNVSAVACGDYHTLFTKTDGTLWAMGENTYYKLGNGSSTKQPLPVNIASNVQSIACGSNHTLFIKTDNTLWAAGQNTYGQLGYASPGTEMRTTPLCVASEVQNASAGDNHSLYTKPDATCWSVGENSAGQLGDGTTINRCEPARIFSTAGTVFAGYNHNLFLKSDGTLLAFGSNIEGQLGDKTSAVLRSTPVTIASNVSTASAGYRHTLFVKTDGSLWATGYNIFGQLGNASTTSITAPVQILASAQSGFAGGLHSLFFKTNGSVWASGFNYYGEFGDGSNSNSSVPVQIAGTWLTAAAGYYHTLLLKSDNTAWSAGQNSFGQLGNSSYTNQATPVQVLAEVQAIAAGQYHSLWLKTDHTLWASGDGSSGQLARGSTGASTTPVKVAANVQSIAAGAAHTLFTASGDIRTAPPAAPTLSGFSPTYLTGGSSITINGTGFTGAVAVYFNGVEASAYTVVSSVQITATAPANVTAGKIVVNTFDGYATSASNYIVGTDPNPPTPTPTPTTNNTGGKSAGAPGLAYLVALGLAALARRALCARRR